MYNLHLVSNNNKPMRIISWLLLLFLLTAHNGFSQALDFTAVQAKVDFSRTLQEWDGFGFNYVETAHSSDMKKFAQEYGGFSLLDEGEKQEIIKLVFGDEGLKVGLVKMFLGSLHQTEAGGKFNHRYTTENMRYFVREGLKLTRSNSRDLQIITTLYGPPPYMTQQKFIRGRDLDPLYKDDLALQADYSRRTTRHGSGQYFCNGFADRPHRIRQQRYRSPGCPGRRQLERGRKTIGYRH